MTLTRYNKKRNFKVTSEPSGKKNGPRKPKARALSYVIQKHAARNLHYDFRLELDGVLVSWAVPKGPSFDPSQKRLAVHVEDHPLEYGSFEGSIPRGEYGGGEVIVWDKGVWIPSPEVDPRVGLKKGRLEFVLKGKKLKGVWALVRMGAPRAEKENWLLIKKTDPFACPESELNILEKKPASVISKRTIEDLQGKERKKPRMARTGIRSKVQ